MKQLFNRCILFLRRINIHRRLKYSLAIFFILPLCLFSLYFYRIYYHNIEHNYEISSFEGISQTCKTLDVALDSYRYFCGKLAINPEIQKALRSEDFTDLDREVLSSYMDHYFSTVIYPASVKTVKVLNCSGSPIYDLGYDEISPAQYSAICGQIDEAAGDVWYHVRTYSGRNSIVLGKRVNDSNNMNHQLGYCLVFINEALFSRDLLSHPYAAEGGSLSIVKQDGNLLTSTSRALPRETPLLPDQLLEVVTGSDPFRASSSSNVLTMDQADCKLTYIYSRSLDGYLVSITPMVCIFEGARSIFLLTLIFIVLLLSISILASFLLFYSLKKPIDSAMDVCRDIGRGNLSSRIPVEAHDELSYLSTQINAMLDQNMELLKISQIKEEKKRQLEIAMLRTQINPHFLFNTLSTLQWIAELNQIPALVDIITSLSDIMKQILTKDEPYISIAREIDLLKSYICIQNYRYVNKFTITYDVEPGLADHLIPCFILQPIVENSIYHGTYASGRMIHIQVRACRKADDIVLTVQDDGQGFDVNKPQKQKTGNSIGVSNVRERIAYIYGKQGAFCLDSRPEVGTICTITIPFRKALSQTEQPS